MNKNSRSSVLDKKISNLVTISQRDSSIFTRKTLKIMPIDNYVDFDDIDNFFNRKISNFNLNINFDVDNILNELKNAKSFVEFINILNSIDFVLPTKIQNFLVKDFNENKKLVIKDVINQYEKICQKTIDKFLSFNSKAKNLQRDKGTWNLYLCKYFLKGITHTKKQPLNAPLLMLRVKINRSDNEIIIENDSDDFVINEKLLVYLQRDRNSFEKKVSDFKNIKSLDELISVIEEISNTNIIKKYDKNNSFTNETSDTISSNYKNMTIVDELCLGIFEPTGGKLMEELIYLTNQNIHSDVFSNDSLISESELDDMEINDEPILQIDNLDIYQRRAVRSSLLNNTIIHGPPGTGKSEVITNIIANALYNDKNVLMISEKNAALNVLRKRLKKLNVFSLNLSESEDKNSKEVFYNSIIALSNVISDDWINSREYQLDRNLLNSKDNKLKELIEFKKSINKLEEFENDVINDFSYVKFLDFIKDLGGIHYLKKCFKEDIFSFFENKFDVLNINSSHYFSHLKKMSDFLDKQPNCKTFEQVNDFMNEALRLEKTMKKCEINEIDIETIDNTKKSKDHLKIFFSNKLSYLEILRENIFKFNDDIQTYKKIKRNLSGMINDNFFNEFDKYKNSINSFINAYDNAKPKHRKYILDKYLKDIDIVNKKPWNKFYKSKLSDSDQKNIEDLNELNGIDFDIYDNFLEIVRNEFLFKPINLLYYFNESIFNKNYLDFLNQKFNVFAFIDYSIFKKFCLSDDKWKKIKIAKNVYLKFKEKYPEFVDSDLFNRKINKYRSFSWEFFESLIFEKVKANLINNLSLLSKEDKDIIKSAFHKAKLTRRPSIYKYMTDFSEALKHLFPIWITRPELCSNFVPFQKDCFDYGIFDEASQMFVERAYSLLFRCKINIVAGDDKQLKPTNFFNARIDVDEDNDDEIYDLESQESLLDRSKTSNWKNVMLKNHYRSVSKDLISFSSKYIYDDELEYASMNDRLASKCLVTKNVNGIFRNNVNEQEVEEVIKQLVTYINNDEYKTILIIAFNSKQQELIEGRIQNYVSENNTAESKKIFEMLSNEKINVINIENVQGDEADLVILSICYGRQDPDSLKVKAHFGPIIKDGGKNRLNVAITRAKKKMIAIKSLKASQINDTSNENLLVFKKFILFLDEIDKINKIDEKFKTDDKSFDSGFEEEVYNFIKKDIYNRDLYLDTQYPVGSKKIDIVILDENKEKVLLGIEVDGWKYHKGSKKKFEDIERQRFLEARGYKIFRVLEYEWKFDKEWVKSSILNEI